MMNPKLARHLANLAASQQTVANIAAGTFVGSAQDAAEALKLATKQGEAALCWMRRNPTTLLGS